MPTELKNLEVNRVDLVPAGANSAAFITLYKGKELTPMTFDEILAKMKPEVAEVVQAEIAKGSDELTLAKEALATAEADVAKLKDSVETLEKAKADAEAALETEKAKNETVGGIDEDEQIKKGLAPEVVAYIEKMELQKKAAEEAVIKAAAEAKHQEAIAKADELKALPIEQAKLVDFVEKSADDVVDMLSAIAKAIETTVLTEVGKTGAQSSFTKSSDEAWGKIEKKAKELADAQSISKEKAIGEVIKAEPALYKEYLEGGAN